MIAKKRNQLGQEVVLSQQRLGLMSIKRLEVFIGDVGLRLPLLNVVFFKLCVLDEV